MHGSRRNFFLFGLAAGAVACGGDVDGGDVTTAREESLLWGITQNMHLTGQATAQPPQPSSNQMGRIDYDRPESWRFYLSGQVLASQVAAGGGGINVSWDLYIGVGRSQSKISNWVVMAFPIVGTSADLIQTWTTAATMPPLVPAVPDTVARLSDVIVAQQVNLVAKVTFFTSSQTTVDLQLDAFFAPNVHHRAAWHAAARPPTAAELSRRGR